MPRSSFWRVVCSIWRGKTRHCRTLAIKNALRNAQKHTQLSLKGCKIFYSLYENITVARVPAQNMITSCLRGCVTSQLTFLECAFADLRPPGYAEAYPALVITPPKHRVCSLLKAGTSLNWWLLQLLRLLCKSVILHFLLIQPFS